MKPQIDWLALRRARAVVEVVVVAVAVVVVVAAYEEMDRAEEVMARPMRKKDVARTKTRMTTRGGRIVGEDAGGRNASPVF
jgi:hypothetical protein